MLQATRETGLTWEASRSPVICTEKRKKVQASCSCKLQVNLNPGESLRSTQSCHHGAEAVAKRVATAACVPDVVVGAAAESVAVELDAIQVQALDETCSFGGCHV